MLTIKKRPIDEHVVLKSILMENKMSFIPRGTYNIRTIYEMVKTRYPDLCKDEHVYVNPKNGSEQTSWKHYTRFVLDSLREEGVTANVKHSVWKKIK